VDTGMSRFGLSEAEFDGLIAADGLRGMAISHVMSHLACADEPGHSANAAQLAAFRRMRARLPQAQASLSATSGIWLGPHYHFDLVRPGAGLYGVAPHAGRANPMRPVVRLQVRVMQVREVPTGTFVGYGHTDVVKRPSRLATISAGYADGFMRGIGPRGAAWIGDSRLPVIGRVSMDSTIVDATDHAGPIVPGMLVELLGTRQNVDDVAAQAGTIGYEILTGLGGRYARRFIG
jgi:alanine racemase